MNAFSLRPKIGDVWKIKRKGRFVTKTVGDISRIYFSEGYRLPWIEWERLPKGRYSGIRAKWLMKNGVRIKSASQEEGKNEQAEEKDGCGGQAV